jgi:hypothetical protein
MTEVVNLRAEPYDVYIGRGSEWGNPFVIGVDGGRTAVLKQYKEMILRSMEKDPDLVDRIRLLKGQRLGCYCKPLPCHGDILKEIADGL